MSEEGMMTKMWDRGRDDDDDGDDDEDDDEDW